MRTFIIAIASVAIASAIRLPTADNTTSLAEATAFGPARQELNATFKRLGIIPSEVKGAWKKEVDEMLTSADARDAERANRSPKVKADFNRDEAVYQQNEARKAKDLPACYTLMSKSNYSSLTFLS